MYSIEVSDPLRAPSDNAIQIVHLGKFINTCYRQLILRLRRDLFKPMYSMRVSDPWRAPSDNAIKIVHLGKFIAVSLILRLRRDLLLPMYSTRISDPWRAPMDSAIQIVHLGQYIHTLFLRFHIEAPKGFIQTYV